MATATSALFVSKAIGKMKKKEEKYVKILELALNASGSFDILLSKSISDGEIDDIEFERLTSIYTHLLIDILRIDSI